MSFVPPSFYIRVIRGTNKRRKFSKKMYCLKFYVMLSWVTSVSSYNVWLILMPFSVQDEDVAWKLLKFSVLNISSGIGKCLHFLNACWKGKAKWQFFCKFRKFVAIVHKAIKTLTKFRQFFSKRSIEWLLKGFLIVKNRPPPPSCWSSLNNSVPIKAVTLALCCIQ